jgi:hypothetical protein
VKLSRKLVSAFRDELNLLGTGAAVAACLFAGLPVLIPFVWAAYEAAYLLFVPDSQWYEQRLRRKADAEVEAHRRALKRALLPSLLPVDRERFEELEQIRRELVAHPSAAPELHTEILGKLDFLLERFLHFGSKRAQYLGYLQAVAEREGASGWNATLPTPLRSALQAAAEREGAAGIRRSRGRRDREPVADPDALARWLLAAYDRRRAEVEAELQQEPDPRTRDVIEKNLKVLAQIRENTEQIAQIARNLEHQMGLVADTFALVNGELRTTPAEQMLPDVDDVIGSSQALTAALQEVAPIEQALQRAGRSTGGG